MSAVPPEAASQQAGLDVRGAAKETETAQERAAQQKASARQGSGERMVGNQRAAGREVGTGAGKEESIGAWYGRVLRPILAPVPEANPHTRHQNEGRDITVIQRQLRRYDRADIEAAVREFRFQADAGMLTGWVEKGETFHLMALCARTDGIYTFEKYLHAARKREAKSTSKHGEPTKVKIALEWTP